MARHRIPTGRFKVADSFDQAKKILASGEFGFPVVVKADGLAAGKGVVVCADAEEGRGDGRRDARPEEVRGGRPARSSSRSSCAAARSRSSSSPTACGSSPWSRPWTTRRPTTGTRARTRAAWAPSRPSPLHDREALRRGHDLRDHPGRHPPARGGPEVQGRPLRRPDDHRGRAPVLEFNGRFGDPETQPQMLRLESDLVDLLTRRSTRTSCGTEVRWSAKPSGCVVLASGGYPGPLREGQDHLRPGRGGGRPGRHRLPRRDQVRERRHAHDRRPRPRRLRHRRDAGRGHGQDLRRLRPDLLRGHALPPGHRRGQGGAGHEGRHLSRQRVGLRHRSRRPWPSSRSSASPSGSR